MKVTKTGSRLMDYQPTLCSEALGSQSGVATSDLTRIVTQGDPTVSATCVAVQPPSEPPTRETAGGLVPPRKKGKKRPTPPQTTKKEKKKRSSSFAAAFAQAEKDDLLGVVLVQDNSYRVHSRAEIAWLRRILGQKVDAAIDSDESFIPRFTESGIRNSRFCLSCANGESFDWLKNLLDSIEVEEGGEGRLRLRLATPAEVPKLTRAEVFITGEPPGVPRFLKNIQAQNPALHTERWVLKHQQQTSGSQLLVFGIDPESAVALAAND